MRLKPTVLNYIEEWIIEEPIFSNGCLFFLIIYILGEALILKAPY